TTDMDNLKLGVERIAKHVENRR
ncbi:hypothetical protein MNBD_GAMMA14-2592, partial [hydrothermal vent metagenome]